MTGDEWQKFVLDFEGAREYLSEMSDIVEAWAVKEDVAMDAKIGNTIKVIAIIFIVVIVLLFILAFSIKKIRLRDFLL